MSQKVLFIVNPNAGKMQAKRYLPDILELFSKNGYCNIVQMTAAQGDGALIAKEYGKEADIIVCMGGDGTIHEVICGMKEISCEAPIGYIPTGTTNDFATSLNLSKNMLQAAGDIIKGEARPIDIGLFEKRYFIYVASFGIFTKTSYATPQRNKNVLGHLAYTLEGIKELSALRPEHLRIETESGTCEDDYIFGSISNSISVGGMLKLDPNLVDFSDGMFEILLIKFPQNPMELRECIIALSRKKYESSYISFFKAEKATIYSSPDMNWSLDGEYETGREQIQMKNIHNAIKIIMKNKK